MKKFAIVNKESLLILAKYEAEEKIDLTVTGSWLASEPVCAHIEIYDIDGDCIKAERSGEDIILVLDSNLVNAKAARLLSEAVTEKYSDMNSDVYAQMNTVFGTSKSDSAVAFKETWDLMVSHPEDYVNKAMNDVGTIMTTELEVTTYAQTKLNAVRAYSVYRLERIQQFYAERAAILS
jgi:hypothetical protein